MSDERLPRLAMLEQNGQPFAHWQCSRLHPCPACRGSKKIAGQPCHACGGTGAGPIRPGDLVWCPACNATGLDSDPRLKWKKGDVPPPRPEIVVPPSLLASTGEIRCGAGDPRAEAKREAAAERKAARTRKKQAERRAVEKRKAAREAERARPKYVAPWKLPDWGER